MKLIKIIATLGCLLGVAPLLHAAATCSTSIPASTPTADFVVDSFSGTVTHSKTGLMWQQCALGLSGPTCSTGSATATSWSAALTAAVADRTDGYSDWRLPNLKELRSIVEEKCYGPSINASVFPNTPASLFWSASAYASLSSYAWFVGFNYGYANGSLKSNTNQVRLVRSGQPYASYDSLNPAPPVYPTAPIIGTAVGQNTSVWVNFTRGTLGSGGFVSNTAQCDSASGISGNYISTEDWGAQPDSILIGGLTQGAAYTCAVRTTSTVGMSPWSASSNTVFVGGTPPTAPTIGTAIAGIDNVSVAFTPNAIGSGTFIQYVAVCTTDYVNYSYPFSGTTSPVQVGLLATGAAYVCRAATETTVGRSPWSNFSNMVTTGTNLPDLIVASLTGPGSGNAGGNIYITVTVKNQGSASAASSRLGLFLSTDTTIYVTDLDAGAYCPIPSLAAGETYYGCYGNIGIPANTPTGTYYLGAIADVYGQVAESDPYNNTRATANTIVIVNPLMPVCTLTALPARIPPGQSSTLTASCNPAANTFGWTGTGCVGKTTATCTVTPAVTTPYSVTGTNGSGSHTVSTVVTVKKPVDLTPILMLLLD